MSNVAGDGIDLSRNEVCTGAEGALADCGAVDSGAVTSGADSLLLPLEDCT
jgi:hypothetical protein